MEIVFLLLSIVIIHGYSNKIDSVIKCFSYHGTICNDKVAGSTSCNIYTNPICCHEHENSCSSYDGADLKNVEIAQIDRHFGIHLSCTDTSAQIDVLSVIYYLTKHTNDICKHPGCIDISLNECKHDKCECMPIEDLDMCEESFPEVKQMINSFCNTSLGKCSLQIPRKKLESCKRSAPCESPLNSSFSFCYGQYVKIDFNCKNTERKTEPTSYQNPASETGHNSSMEPLRLMWFVALTVVLMILLIINCLSILLGFYVVKMKRSKKLEHSCTTCKSGVTEAAVTTENECFAKHDSESENCEIALSTKKCISLSGNSNKPSNYNAEKNQINTANNSMSEEDGPSGATPLLNTYDSHQTKTAEEENGSKIGVITNTSIVD